MTAIKAADVNKLRQLTGAGMMDCKKALTESEGDIDEAVNYLRKKGQKVSEKRADKEAAEGAIFTLTNDANNKGILIKLNCETDFVAKTDDFISLGKNIASLALNKAPASLEELQETSTDEGTSFKDLIKDEIAKIGEKIEVSAYQTLEAESVISYIHAGNQIGVLVGLNKPYSEDIFKAGYDVAMQIAAMNPLGVTEKDIPSELIENERAVIKDQVKQEGKPDEIAEKITEGKMKKFYKEKALLHQQFVKDSSQTVQEFLKTLDKDLTVNNFKREAITG